MEQATDEQKFIHNDFIEHIEKTMGTKSTPEDHPEIYSIRGFAGSGKSWLTAKIIKELLSRGIRVAATSPTHKATGVLRNMLLENDINEESENGLVVSTIHSFLNLKMDYGFTEDGMADNVTKKPKLKKNTYNTCLVYTDVLVIAEASMIGNELYKLALEEIGERCSAILYIGDEYQLLPIGEGDNFLFNRPEIRHYGLTKIVRQKEDSLIIKKSQELIEMIKTKVFPANMADLFLHDSGKEIKIIRDPDFLEHYFQNKDSDKITGAFTNKTVDEYNEYIRYIEFPTVTDFLTLEDELVFQGPYMNSKNDILFNNGEQIKLESIKKIDDVANDLVIWRCRADGKQFYIVDPISYDDFSEKCDELAKEANLLTGYNRTNAWKKFFRFQNKFAKVKYKYSTTIHKLQGSTYNHMYYDMRGMYRMWNRDKETVVRLSYVAITRARDEVLICL